MKRRNAPMRAIEYIMVEGQQVFCGPAAIALATGTPVDEVLALANKVLNRKVKGMFVAEVQCVLSHLGFSSTFNRITPRRPLWRVHTRKPTLVLVTGHWVVRDGLLVGDQSGVTLIGQHWTSRKAVRGTLTFWRKS